MSTSPPSANKKGSFSFGKYVSPNPKPISLGGVKFEPAPHIEYKTQQTVETESKMPSDKAEPTQQQEQEQPDHQEQKQEPEREQVTPESIVSPRTQDDNSNDEDGIDKEDDSENDADFSEPIHAHSLSFELDSLKAKIHQLKLVNKTANADANKNGDDDEDDDDRDDERRRIAFNTSVEIVDGDPTADTECETLTDKVSVVRVKRNQTPFKLKNTVNAGSEHAPRPKQGRSHAISSRKLYRTTPIPPRGKQFLHSRMMKTTDHPTTTKSAVTDTASCDKECDKENVLKTTPENEDVSFPMSLSDSNSDLMQFAFNRQADTPSCPSRKPSTASSLSVDSDSQDYAYPASPISKGSSLRLGSPILTPLKSIEHREPFDFQWNNKNQR